MIGTDLNTMLQGYDYAVLLSAESSDKSEVFNRLATAWLREAIDSLGLRYFSVVGMYKGEEESSFLVLCNDYYDVSRITTLGLSTYNQESVLVLDLRKECALLQYVDSVSHIGRGLVQVDEATALSGGNYSIIDNNYWIVE